MANLTGDPLDDDANVTDYWANDPSYFQDLTTHPVTTAIHRIVLPIICAFGILGIILTVIVLGRKNMCTSTNCYLMALAIADLLFLLLLATILADNQLVPHTKPYFSFMIYTTYASIFMQVFLLASIWLTVMLAIERYIAICQPFLAARMCSVKRARLFIIIIFILTFACRTANFWEHKVVIVVDPSTNSSLAYIESTDLSFNEHYMTIYPWVVDGIITSIVPFLSLLVLNARLIWEVRKSTQYIQRNLMVGQGAGTAIQREELQITIMLISVIIVFFVCQAPYVIYTAIASINKYTTISSTFMVFRYVTMLLLTLKSAINFILYCWFSEKFWTTLKKIFCTEYCLRMDKSYNYQNGSYYHLRRFSNCATRESTM